VSARDVAASCSRDELPFLSLFLALDAFERLLSESDAVETSAMMT